MNNQQKEHPKINQARSTIPEENWGLLVVYLKGRLLSSIAFAFRIINEIESF